MEQLIVTIKDGIVEVEVEGVKGSRCLQLTQALEHRIGQTESRRLKKELYTNNIKTHIVSVGKLSGEG